MSKKLEKKNFELDLRWSTERVDSLLRTHEETGVMPQHNPFHEGKIEWRKPNLNFTYTQEELDEMALIHSDILHFAETHCKLMTDEGEIKIGKGGLRPYQVRALLQFKKYLKNVYLASRQIGKCLDFKSKVKVFNSATKNWYNKPIYRHYYDSKANKGFLDNLEYNLLKIADYYPKLENIFVFLFSLVVNINRKFWKYDLKNNEILHSIVPYQNLYAESYNGGQQITALHLKRKSTLYKLELYDGKTLTCADDHLVYLADGTYIEVQKLKVGDGLIVRDGYTKVKSVTNLKKKRFCFDLTVNAGDSAYFSEGILSHNSIVTGIFVVWYLLTNKSRNVVLISQTEKKVRELVEKVDTILVGLPFYLKLGMVYKQIFAKKFDNGCKINFEIATENSAAGLSAHLLYIDEFALIHKNFISKFFRTVYPTMSSSKIARMIITSTPRGQNKFWEIYTNALNSKNSFNPMRTDWWEVPGRDEAWKQEQIMDLGSEEDFNQEYGNQFIAGNTLLFQSGILRKIKGFRKEFVNRELELMDHYAINYQDRLLWHPDFDIELLKDESAKFFLSIDLAEGTGGDYSIINIFQLVPMTEKEIELLKIFGDYKDFFKLIQIGIFRSNEVEIPELSKVFYHLVVGEMVQQNVKVIVENNYEGNYFRKCVTTLYPEDNEIEDGDVFLQFPYNMIWEDAKTFKSGVLINDKIKRAGCKMLKDKVSCNQIVITEKTTSEEAMNFSRNDSGNYEAQTGNDDTIMSVANLCHVFEHPEFEGAVQELMDNINPKFTDLVDKKLKKISGENNEKSEIDDYIL